MRIETLLEGVVKVPRETYNAVMQAVSADVLSRMYNYLNTTDDESAQEYFIAFKKIFAEYKNLYGKFGLFNEHDEDSTTTTKVYLRMAEVDQRYLKNNPNAKKRVFPIDVTIIPSHELTGVAGEYSKRRKSVNAKLTIEVPSHEYIEQVARSPELFETMMHRISGAVEHELMHAVQDMALRQIPDSSPAYYNGDDIDDNKYYTDEIEFSPQIASNAKEFIAYARDVRQLGIALSATDKVLLLKNFVNPTLEPPEELNSATNVFFKTLYYNDKAKWKKAVKYFYGLVHDKF